eukprot:234909_1
MSQAICSDTFLYSFTLQSAGAITNAIYGNFSAPRAQEIIVSRGKIIELLRPDDVSGRIVSVVSWECFGIIQSLAPFRLTGSSFDYIVVGSDSGKIVILQYSAEKNKFIQIHMETYGKSGCRRIVPGKYLATDPRGRSIMIGAVEKSKFVYILNRDASSKLIISSPLEAHKSNTIIFYMCGVDVGFDNPMFACLEIDYLDVERELTEDPQTDELDLGLNHATWKCAEEVDLCANMLICAENKIIYQNYDADAISRRVGDDSQGILIVSVATHKQKDLFFFLVQSELGDIYKVTLSYVGDEVHDIHIKYFDSCPVSTAMCVLKTGYLFLASEFGNHYLFTFKGIGDNDDTAETDRTTTEDVYFTPRQLKNLQNTDEMLSLSPITKIHIEELLGEETPQIYCLCGRGPRSTLRILKHGLSVTEMAQSDIPGNPSAVWSVKSSQDDPYHKYIVVSFLNATMVLSIGETVEEVSNSGFLGDVMTLLVSLIGRNILMQVYSRGIRLIQSDSRVKEWQPPTNKKIVKVSCNNQQVVIAMTGGELAYFELDRFQNLTEVCRKDMKNEIIDVSIAPLRSSMRRSRWMAVAMSDGTLRILSLDKESVLEQKAMQLLGTGGSNKEDISSRPYCVLLEYLHSSSDVLSSKLYCYVGMYVGTLIRIQVDGTTGRISDKRERLIGTRPVNLFRTEIRNQPAIIALSSRTWLIYTHQSKLLQAPLSYINLEYLSYFSSEQCPEGMVSIARRTLRIFTVERYGDKFNQKVIRLRYTPRQMLVHPMTKFMIIIETDNCAYPYSQKQEIQRTLQIGDEKYDALDESFVGVPRQTSGNWASCIRIIDPRNGANLHILELEDNEAAFSMCFAVFSSLPQEIFLIVGTSVNYQLFPKKTDKNFICVYKFIKNKRIELVHKTQVHDIPLALCAYKGKLLAGIGTILRLYDIGKKRLLRKCENKNFPVCISKIAVSEREGSRIFVSDMMDGLHFCTYRDHVKQIFVFADNTTPRHVTCFCELDYHTICYGDKFGNVAVVRFDDDDDENTMAQHKFASYLNGAPKKLADVCHFYVGETVTDISKARFGDNMDECIVYSTVMGTIGVLLPFKTKTNVDLFSTLEMLLKNEQPPLCGRDHIAFRSYYFPAKCVVDGDLIEQYNYLSFDKQKEIAKELLEDHPSDLIKAIQKMTNSIL